jgi:hypothetical protein
VSQQKVEAQARKAAASGSPDAMADLCKWLARERAAMLDMDDGHLFAVIGMVLLSAEVLGTEGPTIDDLLAVLVPSGRVTSAVVRDLARMKLTQLVGGNSKLN